MGTLLQDVNYGLRMLRRSPGFTSVAVLSLALGIGANTAIFSLMNAVMLRSLPVQEPGRLVLFGKGAWAGITEDFPNRSWQLFSYPLYREVQQKTQVFSGVTAIQSMENDVHGSVDGAAETEKIGAQLVSGTFFSVLGVNPVVGRTFTDADDQTPGGHPVAVASYAWWNQRFARDPSIVGKTVTIQSTVYTIIGVAPPEFFGTSVGQSPELWIPLSMEEQIPPGWKGLHDNFFQSLYVMARLKPGLKVEQAQANLNLVFNQILHEYAGPRPTQKQSEAIKHALIQLTSASTGLSELRQQFSKPLIILMVVVGLVLLIACANIANLLLARATTRHKEIAVRMAIGAGRSRLVRQLLTESLLLALLGGVLGIIFASWASHLLLAMVSSGPQLSPLDVAPDARVFGFTLLLVLLTAFVFGAAPAFRATRLELTLSLKEGRGSGRARGRLARAIIVAQVALSLVLLIGSGLFLRSLVNLSKVDTGFDKSNVLLFQLDTASIGYQEDAHLANLQQQIQERVSALPGVSAASFSMFTFNQGEWSTSATVPGYTPTSGKEPEIMGNVVGPGYFRTMGVPLLVGRLFDAKDTASSKKVGVISEAMARKFFSSGSPIGRQFRLGRSEQGKDNYYVEVIGVVRDAKYESLQDEPRPMAYYPYTQHIQYLNDFEVRISRDQRSVIPEIRRAISDVNRAVPVSDVTTLAEQLDRSLGDQKLIAKLSTFFGLLAVFLACMGIYGLMSHAVNRRTNEIGIRMALGAGRRNVLWLVMRETVVLAALGLAIGVPVALASDRWVSTLLFGLTPTDPATIFSAMLILAGVAMVAGYLPARRASLVEPMEALRYE